MKKVYLGLGSNLGDRAAMLRAAVTSLESPGLHVLRSSPVYETEPMDVPGQQWFLNQVIEAETELFPAQLLQRTGKIETRLGRKRVVPKGPRSIDIDILLFGSTIMNTPALTIPHARFRERRFVLAPLSDLAPELRDPVTRQTIQQLLQNLQGQAVRRYHP